MTGKFLYTLYAKPPEDMDQLQARAAKYMSIEENANARKKAVKASTTAVFPGHKRRRQGRFENYTPLLPRGRLCYKRPVT